MFAELKKQFTAVSAKKNENCGLFCAKHEKTGIFYNKPLCFFPAYFCFMCMCQLLRIN